MNLQYTDTLIGRQGRRIPVSIQVDRNNRPLLLSVVAFARGRPVPMGHYAVRDGRVETYTSPDELPLRQRIVLAAGAALGLLYVPDRYEVLDGLRQAHQAFDLTQRSPDIEDFTAHPGLPESADSADDAYVAQLAAQESTVSPGGVFQQMSRESDEALYGALTPQEIAHESDVLHAYMMGAMNGPMPMRESGSDVELVHDPHLGGWPDQ
ncbi:MULTISPECIES: hypothetical protein [unclassified Thioalkalivibrio]|uniref:hypothetical protein n=1 Tax=unclassified Thioalkalivibrio TaxID=2621013 RepID=UPI0003814BB3|nr:MULTISPECIES: hypothetical protein [unclassified Thioalkalivibrio]